MVSRIPVGSGTDPALAQTRRGRQAPQRSDVALRLTLRIDVGGRATLGPGKVRLLELIAQHGSISSAGRAMGMSYRRAWMLIESLNHTFSQPLVAARPGGAGGGGAELLPMGQEIVRRYRAVEAQAGAASAEDLEALRRALGAEPSSQAGVGADRG